jgi:hypothetical protein
VRLEGGFDYPGASLDAVYAMLLDPEFQRQRCEATGALESSVSIKDDPLGPIVTCHRRMPTADAPDFVRRIVGSSVEIVDRLQWVKLPSAPRSALVRLDFTGQPTKMVGQLDLNADDSGTHGRLVADLKGGLPLVGGRIEKAIAPLVRAAMASEQTVGRRWLNS